MPKGTIKGFACKKCGSRSSIITDSRFLFKKTKKLPFEKQEIKYRRRQCKECGHKITTYEVSSDSFDELSLNIFRLKQEQKIIVDFLKLLKMTEVILDNNSEKD